MNISAKKVVVLTYELEVEGNLADKATKEQPLDYIQGAHMLLPAFESALEGKSVGDTFDFTLSAEEGYGEVDPARVIELPMDAFSVDGKVMTELLVKGRMIPMLDGDGNVVQGVVVEVKDDCVVMDFNHHLAGKALHFTGEVIEVREATEKELTEGLHGEFLPAEEHHCCHGGGGCCHGEGHHDGEGCCHGEGHHGGEGCCCHNKE